MEEIETGGEATEEWDEYISRRGIKDKRQSKAHFE